jgi:hypothetical protein
MNETPAKPRAAYWTAAALMVLLVLDFLRGPQFWPAVRLVMSAVFAALWIGLAVRGVNRGGRWAIRKAAALVIGLGLGYLFSFVIYFLVLFYVIFYTNGGFTAPLQEFGHEVYEPIIWLLEQAERVVNKIRTAA